MGRLALWLPLLCLNLVLGVSHLGYLNLPDAGSAITFMHIPAVLAGMLGGPLPGALVGAVFGLSSWAFFAPHDVLVQFVPRVLIGVSSALAFRAVQAAGPDQSRLSMGALAGALAGSLTNTLGCSLLALIKHLYPPGDLLKMALFHGSIEAVLAVLVSVPVVVFLHHET